jgi:hypothetical protein
MERVGNLGCEVDACMAEGDELVVAIDGEEERDADTVTPETFTCRDHIETDGGAA